MATARPCSPVSPFTPTAPRKRSPFIELHTQECVSCQCVLTSADGKPTTLELLSSEVTPAACPPHVTVAPPGACAAPICAHPVATAIAIQTILSQRACCVLWAIVSCVSGRLAI